jgi:putative transposase
MELEVDEVVGPKGKHTPDRVAKRHGHADGSMTLGGRRVAVRRPRLRTADDQHELPMETYEYFADRDPLTRAVMDRMLAGVSTRKFAGVGEQVEQTASATSKTSVSEMFVERTATALGELMGRRLDDVRLVVMMLDGLEIAERTHVVALGVSTEGVKIPLGLREGSTENATLARTLPADLVDRGLDPEQAILFVGRRHARCRAAVPQDHRLPRPRQARHRDPASHHPRRPEEPRPRGGRSARYRLTVNPPGSPPKLHDDPDTLPSTLGGASSHLRTPRGLTRVGRRSLSGQSRLEDHARRRSDASRARRRSRISR